MSDGFTQLDGELTLSIGETGSVGMVANNLTTDIEGYALDARQGRILNETKLDKTSVLNNLITIAAGYALDARQGKWLDENKIGFGDIANNLTTYDASKVLSAAQGHVLNEAITNALSQLKTANDAVAAMKEITDAIEAAFNISGNAVDFNGKYIDNAVFR